MPVHEDKADAGLMTHETLMREFPHFAGEALPDMPPGFIDESWHNDTCPHWAKPLHHGGRLCIWIEHSDAAQREFPETLRYTVSLHDKGLGNKYHLYESDSWDDVLAFLAPDSFADAIYEPIRTHGDLYRFCIALEHANKAFHFEDNPLYIWAREGESFVTESEASQLEDRIGEAYGLEFKPGDSPIGFALMIWPTIDGEYVL